MPNRQFRNGKWKVAVLALPKELSEETGESYEKYKSVYGGVTYV
jgi:hypothetical protein